MGRHPAGMASGITFVQQASDTLSEALASVSESERDAEVADVLDAWRVAGVAK